MRLLVSLTSLTRAHQERGLKSPGPFTVPSRAELSKLHWECCERPRHWYSPVRCSHHCPHVPQQEQGAALICPRRRGRTPRSLPDLGVKWAGAVRRESSPCRSMSKLTCHSYACKCCPLEASVPLGGDQLCQPRALVPPSPPRRTPDPRPRSTGGTPNGLSEPAENQPSRSAGSSGHLAPAKMLSGWNVGLLWKEQTVFQEKLEI